MRLWFERLPQRTPEKGTDCDEPPSVKYLTSFQEAVKLIGDLAKNSVSFQNSFFETRIPTVVRFERLPPQRRMPEKGTCYEGQDCKR